MTPAQDIVERLLRYGRHWKVGDDFSEDRAATCDQAADTISRLTADNEALRKERDFEQSSRLTSEAQLGIMIRNLEREFAEARAEVERQTAAGYCDAQWLSDGPPFKCGWQQRAETAEARVTALEADVERLLAERDDLQSVFDLRWKADMRAIARWRDAGPGRELTLPDHVDLVIFLFEWVEELLGALEPFARFAEKAERFVQGRADFGGSPIMPTKHFRLADFRRARAALGGSDHG